MLVTVTIELMAAIHSGIPGSEWDQHLHSLGGHLYQSTEWARFQQAQGREVQYSSGADWAWLGALRRGRGGVNYLYCAYGPTICKKGLGEAIKSLRQAGTEYKADFVRIEPIGDVTEGDLLKLGARRFQDMQPQYTLLLDLRQSEEEMRHVMSPSNRNLINTASKRGLSFRLSPDPADLEVFLDIQRETVAKAGIVPHPDEYHRQLAKALTPGTYKLFFADYEGKPAAAAICLDYDGVRYYVHAGTYPELNRQVKAAIALLWWLILDAKATGLHTFDYGGVAPEDQPNHPWAGHSRFKRSVGGVTINRIGTWDLPLKPTKYRAYRLLKKVLPI